jgi:hypothetical protein
MAGLQAADGADAQPGAFGELVLARPGPLPPPPQQSAEPARHTRPPASRAADRTLCPRPDTVGNTSATES